MSTPLAVAPNSVLLCAGEIGGNYAAISFVIASAILAGGLYLLYLQIFHSKIIYGIALMGAAMAIAVGAGWLFGDFILPLFRKKQ